MKAVNARAYEEGDVLIRAHTRDQYITARRSGHSRDAWA